MLSAAKIMGHSHVYGHHPVILQYAYIRGKEDRRGTQVGFYSAHRMKEHSVMDVETGIVRRMMSTALTFG